jgi:hypothetical protein
MLRSILDGTMVVDRDLVLKVQAGKKVIPERGETGSAPRR